MCFSQDSGCNHAESGGACVAPATQCGRVPHVSGNPRRRPYNCVKTSSDPNRAVGEDVSLDGLRLRHVSLRSPTACVWVSDARPGGFLSCRNCMGGKPAHIAPLQVVCVSGSQPGGFLSCRTQTGGNLPFDAPLPDYADALRSGSPTMEAHQAARQDKTARQDSRGYVLTCLAVC
jgi:hypothetical protein